MPDFPNEGEEGGLPADFQEWQRGVTYTSDAALLRPVPPRRELRLNATVRRITFASAPRPSYALLYERATAIVQARVAQLTCIDPTAQPQQWILAHAWFSHEVGTKQVHSATVTLGMSFEFDGVPAPRGESPPDTELLRTACGGDPQSFASKHVDETGARHLDALYVEFAHSDADRDVTVSYGEYVPSCQGVDFAEVITRAGALATFYCERFPPLERRDTPVFQPLRRQWHCLSTGKARDSQIAIVHLYFRIE